MKKIKLLVLFATLFLFSCNKSVENDDLVDVSYSVTKDLTIGNDIESKSSERPLVDFDHYDVRYILEVWDKMGNLMVRKVTTTGDMSTNAEFNFRIVKGEYDILFWADYVTEGTSDDYNYITNSDKGLNQVKLGATYNIGNASKDAFCNAELDVVVDGPLKLSSTLSRPFAYFVLKSINDIAENTAVKVRYKNQMNSYNVATGVASSDVALTDWINFPILDKSSKTLTFDYLFVPTDSKVSFDIMVNDIKTIEVKDLDFSRNRSYTLNISTLMPVL